MNKSTLVQAHIIFRHGQRAPDSDVEYPGDPYANEKYLPFGPNELTLTGRKQSYHLGLRLRQRYATFLGPEYYQGLIDAKCTERSRAITTIQLVLAGLFPPTSVTQIHATLNWQPIPFTYKPLKEDKLLGSAPTNMRNVVNSSDFRKSANSKDIIQCIKKELNWDIKEQGQCTRLYHTLLSQVDFELPIPKWCASIFPEKLKTDFESYAKFNMDRKNFVVGACGGLIQEITKFMKQKINEILNKEEEKVPKMFLYSAHDLNLSPLLSVFKKLDATKWPLFTANLTFELHLIDGKFYVKILYQDGLTGREMLLDEKNIIEITLPNSTDTFIKFNGFSEYVEDYFPE